MPFWIYDIEEDKILGLFPNLSENSNKVLSFLYIIFWLENTNSFFFQQEIALGRQQSGKMIEKALIIYASIQSFLIISILFLSKVTPFQNFYHYQYRNRQNQHQNQIIPEEFTKFSTKSIVKIPTPLSNINYDLSRSRSQNLHLFKAGFLQTKKYSLINNIFFIVQIVLCSTILISHTFLLFFQITSSINANTIISGHLLILINSLSSIPLNTFSCLSMTNLLANLYICPISFQQYYNSTLYSPRPSKLNRLLSNFLTNFCEIYILTINCALFVSSIIGFAIIGDYISLILFYLYIALIGIYLVYKYGYRYFFSQFLSES